MWHSYWFLFWIIGLVAVGIWVTLSFFSHEARLGRRRRKSHSRIISKSDRPRVRFSVRVPKEKKEE